MKSNNTVDTLGDSPLTRAQNLRLLADAVYQDYLSLIGSDEPITVAELAEAIRYGVPVDDDSEEATEQYALDILCRIASERALRKVAE